jgi:uncharacterized protein
LSKDALAGNVPLRTFGQLKQLWEAKVEPKVEHQAGAGVGTVASYPSPPADAPEANEPTRHEPEAAEIPTPPSEEADSNR